MPKEFDGFILAPIHPFTKRQGELIEQIIEGKKLSQAAQAMGLAKRTARWHFYGKSVTDKPTQSVLGIAGIVEEVCGIRPNPSSLAKVLLGDVVFPYSNRAQ
jgi:hypothetical protein